jgi:hypothetical protein
MDRKRLAVLRISLVIFAIFTIDAEQTRAVNPSQLSLRVSGSSFWNQGWGSKFFFHYGNLEDLINDSEGEMRSWNRTLQHYSGPNLEIRWAKPLSRTLAVTISGKYQHLGFRLGDSFIGDSITGFDWIRWHKLLDAKLHFISVGAGIQVEWKQIRPYANVDFGYCLVNLTTSQIEEGMFSPGVSAAMVCGRGGGLFFRWTAGTSVPVWKNIRLVAESSYLFCRVWDPIPAEEVRATFDDPDPDDAQQVSYNSLITGDRQISRIHGFGVSLGIEVAIR